MRTSLYDKHVELGAKMVDFAGFEMPIQYKNLKEEVLAVRNSVGVFDVSHMGEFFITGPDAAKFVNYMITNNIEKLADGKAIYSPLCNEKGTIIDDLIAYKFNNEEILICVNAANIEKDFKWFDSHKGDFNVTLSNQSDKYSLLAIQGPKTFETLKSIELLNGISDSDYYSIQKLENGIILARTGYTGEDGFEVFAPHNIIDQLWDELIKRDVKPCGLGSRDVLRLEVCFPLYGNELNEKLTPLDCGLKWTTKLDKEKFIGKEALLNYQAQKKLIKLTLEKGIPRAGYKLKANEQEVGEITSGSMSVVLGKGIALALVNKEFEDYDNLKVDIRNKLYDTTKVTKPFVSGGHK